MARQITAKDHMYGRRYLIKADAPKKTSRPETFPHPACVIHSQILTTWIDQTTWYNSKKDYEFLQYNVGQEYKINEGAYDTNITSNITPKSQQNVD